MRYLRTQRLVQILVLCLGLSLCASMSVAAEESVAVAASLGPTMEKLAEQFSSTTGNRLTLVNGASGKLAAQIEAGAPFTLFLSANEKWARHLESKGVLTDVHPYAESPLVLWWGKESAPTVEMLKESTMKVAIADPAAAPLGELAKEWLIRKGMFQVLEQEKRLVIAGDILKTALAVKSGGADLAFVALGTAQELGGGFVRVSSPPARYFGGLVKNTATNVTAEFWRWLRSSEAAPLWEKAGFDPARE
ncbi:molybdate ABC transporter substrate-binding protein [Aminiphilus circumscriptus]|uniref:molybdate ABC transporter substrate-binding protein n=1 Tax=Aminiphilus circumscriptus TaxID=290732 RepID=UPI00049295E0|nr:molybdate ABC transporter substrate-binding protein [Aminiphilus circumscriptus]